jgi:general secretion pathway protein H
MAGLPTSRTGSVDLNSPTSGYMLLDMALALSLLLLLSSILWPSLGRGTTRLQQSVIALEIANVIRSDRTSATITGVPARTRVDLNRRAVIAANGSYVKIADDLAIEVTTGAGCEVGARQYVIVFAPDGRSCGGQIVLRKGRLAYVVRFNKLTGMVELYHSSNA